MAPITFDTLKLARKLEAAGFSPKQAADTAEALASSLGEASDLVTKADLANLATKADIGDVRGEIADVRREIAEAKADVLKWMFGMSLAQIGAIVALLKLIR